MPVAQRYGYKDVSALISEMLRIQRIDLEEVVTEALTTNETYFFRDVHPFDSLQTVVIPELIKARSRERRLTIWCGASSTGQEPYSIAMLLTEEFPELRNWTVEIIATDYSRKVLERAREGVYSRLEINRGLPVEMLTKYFKQESAGWRLRDSIRNMVQFSQLNLLKVGYPLPNVDLLFLRNVLIYFDLPTKQSILANVRERLKPDGCLFLGAAETTLNVDNGYRRRRVGATYCYELNPSHTDVGIVSSQSSSEPIISRTESKCAIS